MRKIENITYDGLQELSYKIKIAKIILVLNKNCDIGKISDILYMEGFSTCNNETLFEFLFSELNDFIEFEYDNDYENDIKKVQKFIQEASEHIKFKMGV